MFRPILIPLLAVAVAGSVKADVDLKATMHEYMAEGVNHQELVFKDGKRTITMDLPNQWTYLSTGDRLQLLPPKAQFAEGVVQTVPMAAPRPLDDAAKKIFTDQIRASVPPNSEAITVDVQDNPIVLNGNESFEVVLSYKNVGYVFQSSAILLNCPENQLIYRFTARKNDFEALNQTFRRAILSWQWSAADAPN